MFGDRDSGAYLLKFARTKITRHTLVKGWASPDTPSWPATGRPSGDAGHPARPAPDRPPRQQARRPRLRSHPLRRIPGTDPDASEPGNTQAA